MNFGNTHNPPAIIILKRKNCGGLEMLQAAGILLAYFVSFALLKWLPAAFIRGVSDIKGGFDVGNKVYNAMNCAVVIVLAALLIGLWAAPAWPAEVPAPWSGAVVRWIDGDTVIVTRPGHKDARVRLAWVDCPELAQPFGADALRRARELAPDGSRVFIWPMGMGHYGRALASVYTPGLVMINYQLAADGLAWVRCRRACPNARELADLARELGWGLWGQLAPEAPWDWRKRMKGGR